MKRPIILSEAERLLLADIVRTGFIGWATCCVRHAVTVQHLARENSGWSRFVAAIEGEIGIDYRPRGPGHVPVTFPLTVREVSALSAALEYGTATQDEILAAGMLGAHCPFAQPDVGGKAWRRYKSLMQHLELDFESPHPYWGDAVLSRLGRLRAAVASELLIAAE